MTFKAILSRYRTRTTTRDLALGLAMISTAMLLAIGLVNYALYVTEADRNLNQQATRMADQLASVLSAPLWTLDLNTLRQIADAYRQSENVAGLTILDENGAPLYASAPVGQDNLTRTRTLYHGQQVIGQVELSVSRQSLRIIQEQVLASTAGAILLLVLAIMVTTDRLLQRFLGQPLRQLTQGIDHIAHGHYQDVILPVPVADIDHIIGKVNAMAQQIADRDTALRQREEQFRQAITSISDHIYLTEVTAAGQYINRYFSPNVELLTGYPVAAFLADWNFWPAQLIHPEDRAAAEAQVRRLASGQDSEMEYRLVCRSGQVIWVRDSARVEAVDGSTFIYGVISDFTERKRAAQVQAAIYHISEAAHAAQNLVELYGAIHRIIRALMPARNFYIALLDAATGLLHFPYHADEHETEAWDPMPPGKSLIGYVLRTGKPLLATPEVFEQLVQTGDVELIGALSRDWLGVPLKTQQTTLGIMAVQIYAEEARLTESDQAILTFVSTQVATAIERKQAEAALLVSLENLKKSQEISHVGNWSWDIVADLFNASDEGLRLMGFPPGAQPTFAEIVAQMHPDDRDRAHAALTSSLQTGRPYQLEIRVFKKDTGEPRYILSMAEIEQNADGRPVRVFGINQDITERKQTEDEIRQLNADLEQRVAVRTLELSAANRQLRQAIRAKDDFLAGMSHELRTPLTAVLGLAEALQLNYHGPLTDQQAHYVQLIHQSGEHLLALINDVLDLAKVSAGRLVLEIAPVSVVEICQAAVRLVTPQAGKKQISVLLTVDPAVTVLQADARRLKQILVNLLGNAVKFTPADGQAGLTVRGNAKQGVAEFTVWDTGIGIAAEDLPRLFQDFVQLDTRLARDYEGTGLGLATVWRLAELHGGQVKAESDGPGKGSRFTVSLPWAGEKTLEPPAANHSAETAVAVLASDLKPTKPALVLIAEDNPIILNVLQSTLAAQGYPVVVAEDGEAALAQARQLRPALVVMDLQMPKLDGLEAIRQMRADPALAATPVLALTARAMPGDRERCLAAGANDYLSKPVNLREFISVVRRLVAA